MLGKDRKQIELPLPISVDQHNRNAYRIGFWTMHESNVFDHIQKVRTDESHYQNTRASWKTTTPRKNTLQTVPAPLFSLLMLTNLNLIVAKISPKGTFKYVLNAWLRITNNEKSKEGIDSARNHWKRICTSKSARSGNKQDTRSTCLNRSILLRTTIPLFKMPWNVWKMISHYWKVRHKLGISLFKEPLD